MFPILFCTSHRSEIFRCSQTATVIGEGYCFFPFRFFGWLHTYIDLKHISGRKEINFIPTYASSLERCDSKK